MSFSLTSCSGDDDEPDTGNIVGTWKIVDGIADLIDCEQYYQFRNDGTCYEREFGIREGPKKVESAA